MLDPLQKSTRGIVQVYLRYRCGDLADTRKTFHRTCTLQSWSVLWSTIWGSQLGPPCKSSRGIDVAISQAPGKQSITYAHYIDGDSEGSQPVDPLQKSTRAAIKVQSRYLCGDFVGTWNIFTRAYYFYSWRVGRFMIARTTSVSVSRTWYVRLLIRLQLSQLLMILMYSMI